MKIYDLFRRADDVYISFGTENVERRDAEPFYSFDTDVPKVQPLWAKEEESEIYERPIGENQEEYIVDAQPRIEFRFEEPRTLLLAAGEPRKLLSAGRQPLLLAAPEELTQTIAEILGGKTQHVIYFSDVEFRDGVETVVEDRIVREKRRSFLGAKIISAIMMIIGLAAILFPSASLRAAKVSYEVNPTNTTPGLSFSIENNDMTVADGKGNLSIQTQPNQLITSTLDLDVSTTGADGYKLYVTTSGKDKQGDYTNALVNKDVTGVDGRGVKIQSLVSDSVKSAFPAGYWGYTTAPSVQDNTMFKAFPVYDATDEQKLGGVEIASANTAVADEDAAGETPFTIGIKADENLPAGDYANELLFTVIVNPVTITYNLSFNGNTEDDSLADMPEMVTVASADIFRNVAIPAGVPTRDKYAFVGWADTVDATEAAYAPGDEVLMQVANINDSQIVNKTLYAVWEELPDDTKYLQNFNDAIDLRTVGDSDIYVDKRDGTEYTVKRLPDGKVWMTQNLRYAEGAYAISSNEAFGGYYTWEAAQTVCPEGWHLPTSDSSGEFAMLDKAYGYSGSNRTSAAAQIQNYYLTTGNWPGLVQSGQYLSGTLYGQRSSYWSSTSVDSNNAYLMHANLYSGSGALYPIYSYSKSAAATVRCVGNQPNSFYLQDFDESKMLPNTGDSATLTDRRDGATYTVKRLADGKVWMTQNLRYATGAYAVSSNTDYGAYYDWDTAQTVCPAGWHIISKYEVKGLDLAWGGTGVNRSNANTAGYFKGTDYLNLKFGGRYFGTPLTLQRVGTEAIYWTAEEGTISEYGNNLYLNSSNSLLFDPDNSYKMQNKQPVRCIADDDAKVTFNANGGEGTMAVQSFTRGTAQAIAANQFTRTGYKFVGWALSADAAIPKYADEESVKFSVATTLYAVWKTNYFQDFDAKTALLEVGDTATLVDKRDTATYTVKRLPDGKVWMTQNLRYAEGAYRVSSNEDYGAFYSWVAAQNVCPTGWRLPTGGDDGDYVKLDRSYGYTGAWRRDQGADTLTQINNYKRTDENWPGIVLSGYYYNGSVYREGYSTLLWTSTSNTSSQPSVFHINSGLPDNLIYPSYFFTDNGTNNAPVRCIANETETVSFDANGGTGEMADVTVEKGNTITLTNSFTNPAYNFVGWATSADGEKVYDDGATITPTEDMTLYALWTPKGEFMQDFNQNTELLSVDSTTTLYDKRDGANYTVKRLQDGKVWMTKNLAYATGATISPNARGGYYSWSAAQTVCPTGWHLPTSDEYAKMYELYPTVDGFTKSGPTLSLDGRYQLSVENYQYVDSAGYYWNSTNEDEAFSFNNNGQVWLTYNYLSTKYSNQVRCIADYEEYTVSFNANDGTRGVPTAMTVVAGQGVTIPDSSLARDGYLFQGWSTSASSTIPEYVANETIVPTEDITLYAVWQGYMQTASCSSLPVGTTSILVDSRDNQEYTVYRFNDVGTAGTDYPKNMAGKCMVTRDIALGSGADLALDAASSASAATVIARIGVNDWDGTQNDSNMQYISKVDNGQRKNFYTYGAAKAVCPKGWALMSRAQYNNLIAFSGVSANVLSGLAVLMNDPYRFNLGGSFVPATGLINVGEAGGYWTSNIVDSQNAYDFAISNETASVEPASKATGYRVRCIMK